MVEKKLELMTSEIVLDRNSEEAKQQYSKLIRVIEFFSQRFSLENMTQYMYDFVLELFEPSRCSMVILDRDIYNIYTSNVDYEQEISFKKDEKHDQLVYFHPGLLDREFLSEFLDSEIFVGINPDIGIPIIMDKTLYGIIFISKVRALTQDELIIAEALMNLYHLALTNLKNYDFLELVKRELDEKIFNLFAINQASKALLGEQDPSRLMSLSLSVFSELTQSSITSIFLKDSIDGSYHLIDYNNVFRTKQKLTIRLFPKELFANRRINTIIDWKEPRERDLFASYFNSDLGMLDQFNPYYIINFVNNNNLIGFATISNRVTGDKYDKGVFELLESLASSTYVAISNANNYYEVLKHKKLAEDKFSRIVTLNRLIKNMNSANDLQNLVELTLDTLNIAYGYKTSFYASYSENTFEIVANLNVAYADKNFRLDSILDELLEGKLIIEYDQDRIQDLLGDIMTEELSNNIQSMIMIPVYIEGIDLKLLGIICLLDIEEGVISTDENIVTLETISNLVAPIVEQFNVISTIKNEFRPDECKLYFNYCEQLIEEASHMDGEFYVVVVKAKCMSLFNTSNQDSEIETGLKAYQLDSNHLGFVSCSIKSIREVIEAYHEQKILQIQYSADFHDITMLKKCIDEFVYE